jgi:hypothetical protein
VNSGGNFSVIQIRGGSWSCDFGQVSYAQRGTLVWPCCTLPRWAVSQRELQSTRLSAEQLLQQPTVEVTRAGSLADGFEPIGGVS